MDSCLEASRNPQVLMTVTSEIARLQKDASDLFAIYVVFGATKGDDFYIGCGHAFIMIENQGSLR